MLPKKLYLFISIGLVIGYLWIGFHLLNASKKSETQYSTCLIKTVSGYPCPSCGSSRAVLSLAQGDFKKALLLNPFGVLMGFLMVVLPFWLLFDIVLKRKTFYNAYSKMEAYFRKKWVVVLFIIIVLANWIWNICKGL